MTSESDADQALLRRICAGEQHALGELFRAHRERLRRMVQLRLDRRLQGRIPPHSIRWEFCNILEPDPQRPERPVKTRVLLWGA